MLIFILLAQKTPSTALTLAFTNSWGTLCVYDILIIKYHLFEDYRIRFLILNYLNYKRYWLKQLIIKYMFGFYFCSVQCLKLQSQTKFLRLPITLISNKLNFLLGYIFLINVIKSKKPKYIITRNFLLTIYNFTNLFFKIFSFYFSLKDSFLRKKFILRFQNPNLKICTKTKLNFLLRISFFKINLRKILFIFNKIVKEIYYCPTTLENIINNQKDFLQNNININDKKYFRFLSGTQHISNIIENNRRNLISFFFKQELLLKTIKIEKLNVFYPIKVSLFGTKQILLEQRRFVTIRCLSFIKFFFFIRFIISKFFKKRRKLWVSSFVKWMRKWGFKRRFKRNLCRRFSQYAFLFLSIAFLIKKACFLDFQLFTWERKAYLKVTNIVIFEHFKFSKFLIPLVIATQYIFRLGSICVLIDCIRSLFMRSGIIKHGQILDILESIIIYWLCYFQNLRVLPSRFCQGVKMEIIGKIDGVIKAKTWRIKTGAIPVNDFKGLVKYEQTIIPTKYGILHFHVWLFFIKGDLT